MGGGRRGEELGWAGKGEMGCGEGGGQLARTTRPLGCDTAPHAEGHREPMKRHKKEEKSRGWGSSAQKRKG